jgi:hypothetical protein
MRKITKLTVTVSLALAFMLADAPAWAWFHRPLGVPEIAPTVVRGMLAILGAGVLMLGGRRRRS